MLRISRLTRRVKHGWVGIVRVYRGERRLWQETVQIVRLTAEDALADANKLADEYLLRA